MSPEQFSSAVLDWYDRNGRHDLPWQQGITPYRVWVSEIMLQQTQVSTVLNYFGRFMEALPTVQALAEAPEDEVLHLWTGLGYYTRARNLQKTAKIVVEQYGGEFPRDVEKLTDLPGIGLSTAGAIASISMGLRAPILDGNVKRVLARYTAQEGYPGEPKVAKALWANAERYTPHSRVNHYTQAMMDLGATLCTRSKPSCLLCPLKVGCEAHMLGQEIRYPVPKPRKELPQKRTADAAAGQPRRRHPALPAPVQRPLGRAVEPAGAGQHRTNRRSGRPARPEPGRQPGAGRPDPHLQPFPTGHRAVAGARRRRHRPRGRGRLALV
ncbi:UNVERIFIED_ORG: A/G-specific adenine glycosylase [Pseudomonas vranovensis]|nr:A/G-specific adenine glycosylase [Pseudomonas vranovensis]